MSRLSRRSLIAGLGATGIVGAIASNSSNAIAKDAGTPQGITQPIAQATKSQSSGKFAGKVVLITGATSGIGKVTAEMFAQEGAKVFFCGRRVNLGQQVESDIRRAGGEATYMKADVRQPGEVKAFVDACVAKYGRLDIVFNNAGVDYPPGAIADTSIEEFDDLMSTNARGVFLGMKYSIPHLLKSGGGAIINNASIGGHRAFPNIVGYGASKAAVIHMTKMAAQEYGKNIRINAIAPGAIDTPMWDRVQRDWKLTTEQLVASYPSKRVGKPEEVSQAVMWLASTEAGYVSGMRFDIDGGGLG
jgi:NAD(P)-dependent dehydrogenase (short-subunit alcohol dehydrogenase family)